MALKSHNTKKHSVYYFEPIQLYSTQFSGPIRDQKVYFEVLNVKEFPNGKLREIVIGSSSIELKPIIDLDRSSLVQLKVLGKEGELVGKLSFGHSKLRPVLTFLDYKINMNIDFVPIIVMDYSLSTVIDASEGVELNDSIPVINHIRHVYKDISNYCMGYGIGAKTCPKQIRASDIFALNGNIFDPTISYNKILE